MAAPSCPLRAALLLATPLLASAGVCCSGAVAVASCWGWDPLNATVNTRAIQAALDCAVASTVRVPAMPGPWVVAPPPGGGGETDPATGKVWRTTALNFSLASNTRVVFEPGCVVEAERWAFHEVRAPLAIVGSLYAPVHNLTIIGDGAEWRMHKRDYQNASCELGAAASRTCYAYSEWRHGLSLWWGIDVVIRGLRIADTGGDGVILGGMEGGGSDRSNVVALTQRATLSNLTCDGNHRQGLSVINCVTCIIEDCTFLNTNGTKPMAGVDIEPDNAGASLQDIVFRRCVSRDNMGNGYQLTLGNLDPTIDPPVSVTFEDCHAIWTPSFDWPRDYLKGETNLNGFQFGVLGDLQGSLSVVGGSVTGSAGAGLCIVDKPAAGATISISGLVLTDTARFDTGQDAGMHAAPIHLIDEIGGMGGIHLTNIVVHQRPRSTSGSAMLSESPALRYDATTCGHGPPSPCPNRTTLRGSTIFVRPSPTSGGGTSDCGSVNAVASLDGTTSRDGSVFAGGRDVFENITLVCCSPAYIAAHPHNPQTFDGCRV